MAEKMIRLEALCLFRDGNAFPRVIEAGEEVIVTQRQAKIMRNSDPDAFKQVGFVIPKSTAAPVEKGKGDDKKS
jgi:hypothetical protein